jgi:ribosome-binding protein aMBF1 (putative translation factor)
MANSARRTRKSVHSPGQLAFRRLITDARKKAGLTQQKLAKRLKRPQSFVAKCERGERRVDVLEFIEIAEGIGTDPVALLRELIRRKGERR